MRERQYLVLLVILFMAVLYWSCSKESGNADKNTGSGIITENSANKVETQGSILSIGNNLVGTWSSVNTGTLFLKMTEKLKLLILN